MPRWRPGPDTVSRVQLTVVDHPLARARLSRMRDERTDNAELPGRAARPHPDARLRGHPRPRRRRGADPARRSPATTGYRLAAAAADRAGAAGRPGHGRHRAPDAARVADGLRRAGPQRGDLPARGLHGLAAGVAGRPRRLRPRPDAGHRRLAGALLRPAHRARRRRRSPCSARWPRPRACGGSRRAACRCGCSPPASTSGSTSNAYIVPGLGDAGDRQFGAV